MIKDKSLAKQFVKGGDEYKRVRRIVSMDNIKALAEENQQGEHQRGTHAVPVLPKIPEEAIARRRLRIAINAHTVRCFPKGLARARRTDDRHPVACGGQCIGLSANPKVPRVSLILQEHHYSVIGGRFHESSLLDLCLHFIKLALRQPSSTAPGVVVNP